VGHSSRNSVILERNERERSVTLDHFGSFGNAAIDCNDESWLQSDVLKYTFAA